MSSGWNLSVKKLQLLKMDLERQTIVYLACKRRHNDQRQLVRWMGLWEHRHGLSLEVIVDCYWDKILEWMAGRHVRFVPDQARVVAEFLQNDYDVHMRRFETLLWIRGLSLEDVFDLRRTAIQRILVKRGCSKHRV